MFVIKMYVKVVLNFLLNLSKVTNTCQNYIPAKGLAESDNKACVYHHDAR